MKSFFQMLVAFIVGFLVMGAVWLASASPRGHSIELLPAPTDSPLNVHVAGAVRNPGVYTVLPGGRVADAIQSAGGFLPQANQNLVNLAEPLKDGQKVTIPERIPTSAPGSAVTAFNNGTLEPPQTATPTGPVNLNTASLEELQTLPGIGPSKAQNILDYRVDRGAFSTVEEIQNVDGIGPTIFQRLKDLITVE